MESGSKILIVDDDRTLTGMLSELLRTEGFDCAVANDGAEALRRVNELAPELVVLDVMMPGDDGIATLCRLRETSAVPVLMLTAMGEDEDRILGLEAGADDYLAKPFAPRELVLRIRAILRRTGESGPDAPEADILAGPLAIEPARQRARCAGVELSLTGAELRILAALAAAPGRVVSREQLTESALGRRLTPYDRALDTHVSHLRRKLGNAGSGERIEILSVRGSGYRLVID